MGVKVPSALYGYTDINGDGSVVLYGPATAWKDELGDLLALKRIGTRITEDLAEGTLLFADNCQVATDYAIVNVQLNHDRDLTQPLKPHLHWFQASANVPNWLLQYRWQRNGLAKVTSWTNLKCTTEAFLYTSGTILQICYSAAIAVPTVTDVSDIVQFRLCRDTNNSSGEFGGADPLSGNASALMFDVHFVVDSFGSDDEYVKY